VRQLEPPEVRRVRVTVSVERGTPPAPVPPDQRHTFYRAEYLPREREAEVIEVDEGGAVNLRLERVRDLLVLATPSGEWINPYSPALHRLGITIFKLRGVSHYEVAVKAGDFSPGASVRLVREPDNQHDPNAIAVNAADGTGPAGYVNKQNVARLTKRLNRSEQLDAIAIRGAPSGQDGVPIMVLVTDLGTLEVFSPVARVRDCARSRSTAPMSEHSSTVRDNSHTWH